jgi:4-hydroxy-3-polyprenylbenzoate decarboxylase
VSAAGAEVGLWISDAGVQVCGAELFGDISLSRDDVTARLTDGLDGVTVVGLRDYTTPYASGSARVDGYVVCPCSMSTAASIAAGAMANLVHRAASVALKEERKLVLVPRETPLSTIHLENLLRLRRAGATVLFAAPGFYHAPQTIDDLVNFVVARCLDQLGIDQTLVSRWGQ